MNQIEITCTKKQLKVIKANSNNSCIAGYCPCTGVCMKSAGDDSCPYAWNNIKVHIVQES